MFMLPLPLSLTSLDALAQALSKLTKFRARVLHAAVNQALFLSLATLSLAYLLSRTS